MFERVSVQLRISTMPSFATNWLVPRLPKFRLIHSSLDVHVSIADRFVDFSRDGIDLAIRYGSGDWPGTTAELLFEDIAVPVCSPSVVSGTRPLQAVSDLAEHTLLHDDSRPGWREWLRREPDGDQVDPSRGLHFSHSHLALQAAVNAQGIALASAPLARDALDSGHLVRPFETESRVEGAYYVVRARHAIEEAKSRAFRDWLMSERG